MDRETDRAWWREACRHVGDLVQEDREGLRLGLAEAALPEEQRAWLLRAIVELEDDDLELAARAVERARQLPPTPGAG